MWHDTKFRWMIFSVAIVAVFEFFSLAQFDVFKYLLGAKPEWQPYSRWIAAPFFAAIIVAIGWRTIWSGLKALSKLNFRSINLLMVIAMVGAFYLGEFEEAAVVITLFTLGETLEKFGIASSKSALQALVDRAPKTAEIKGADGQITTVPLAEINVGDILILKPSDMIAMDAEVVTGASSVDESTITGEPLPKDKHAGDLVFAGTLNMLGYLEAKVTKLAADSTLAKIIETTFAATKTKAETQKFIETFAGYYTPSIIFIATLLVLVPTLLFNLPFNPWFEQAITILVIACPCALVISTPISIYASIGNASARGAPVSAVNWPPFLMASSNAR